MILMFYQNSNNQFAIFSKINCPIHDFVIKFSPIQKEILIKKSNFVRVFISKQQQQNNNNNNKHNKNIKIYFHLSKFK